MRKRSPALATILGACTLTTILAVAPTRAARRDSAQPLDTAVLSPTTSLARRQRPALVAAEPTVPPTVPAPLGTLRNGDFEGSFSYRHDPYTGLWAGELEVADRWAPWYDNRPGCPPHEPDCDPASHYLRPEYKPERETDRVRSGAVAQKQFTTYGTHQAGLFQKVVVTSSSWLSFGAWVWVWSSDKDVPAHSFLPGGYGVSVGIDPEGGDDWSSPEIIWTSPVTVCDQWVPLQVAAYCPSGHASVWTRGAPLYPVKHNDSYWDDAVIEVLSAPPEATRTPTPTLTPYPTLGPTPDGAVPTSCTLWQPQWRATASDFGRSQGSGTVFAAGDSVLLRNGVGPGESFPLVWLTHALPTQASYRLTVRFSVPSTTGWGTGLGIGSRDYDGHRVLAGSPDPKGIDDIVRMHANEAQYVIELLGARCWETTPDDTGEHILALDVQRLDVQGQTPAVNVLTLSVDGLIAGEGVTAKRPRSLFAGSPVIMWVGGRWTDLNVWQVSTWTCGTRLVLPLIWDGPRVPIAQP